MPSPDAPHWWADVQQDRADFSDGREAESWLEEEIDFVPRRRFARGAGERVSTPASPLIGSSEAVRAMERRIASSARDGGSADPLHGVFVLTQSVDEDDAFEERPASREHQPARRTVTVTGNPSRATAAAVPATRPRRARTAVDRIGPRPDRIAMWAVLLGALLIILAITSADSHAATQAAAALQSR